MDFVIEALEGFIFIEEWADNRIKGTFNFIGRDEDGYEYAITEGKFDMPIN